MSRSGLAGRGLPGGGAEAGRVAQEGDCEVWRGRIGLWALPGPPGTGRRGDIRRSGWKTCRGPGSSPASRGRSGFCGPN